MTIVMTFKKMFSKQTDREVEAIVAPVRQQIKNTTRVAKHQRDLYRKNGVAMQIYIAKGGDHQ